MSVLSHFENHKKHDMQQHSWEDVLFALQIPIALTALVVLFLLAIYRVG